MKNIRQKTIISSGFTLIEVLISLLFLGILSSIAAMGIVSGIEVYRISRENAHISQKANIAMMRMQMEISGLTDVITIESTAPYLIYTTLRGRMALAKVDNTIKLYPLEDTVTLLSASDLGSKGFILIDNVRDLQMIFTDPLDNDPSNGLYTFTPGTDIKRLATITITMSIFRQDDPSQTIIFSTTIHPRNIGSLGGTVI